VILDNDLHLIGCDKFIGESPAIKRLLNLVKKVAGTDANIIILGETGTGKELVANIIHANSSRSNMHFIPLDCASLPEGLIESELFGYERGAFTGAFSTRPGIFEYANKGTFFLDEVGDLSLSLQAKLLRVLQEKQFRRVGGRELINVDVRVISASNRDLRKAMEEGNFRADLYYRLNAVTLLVPPLREREEDIRLIANHYLKYYSFINHKEVLGILEPAMLLLENYPWPGNVRELQHVIERAVISTDNNYISPDDFPGEIRSVSGLKTEGIHFELTFEEAKEKWIEVFEKSYLESLIQKTKGNISKAAIEAGVNRKTIHRLLKKYGLERKIS